MESILVSTISKYFYSHSAHAHFITNYQISTFAIQLSVAEALAIAWYVGLGILHRLCRTGCIGSSM